MSLRNRFGMAALLAGSLTLAGCTRTNPYTGEQEIDPVGTALVVGGAAIIGAVAIGASNNNRNEHGYYRHNRRYDNRYYGHPRRRY